MPSCSVGTCGKACRRPAEAGEAGPAALPPGGLDAAHRTMPPVGSGVEGRGGPAGPRIRLRVPGRGLARRAQRSTLTSPAPVAPGSHQAPRWRTRTTRRPRQAPLSRMGSNSRPLPLPSPPRRRPQVGLEGSSARERAMAPGSRLAQHPAAGPRAGRAPAPGRTPKRAGGAGEGRPRPARPAAGASPPSPRRRPPADRVLAAPPRPLQSRMPSPPRTPPPLRRSRSRR